MKEQKFFHFFDKDKNRNNFGRKNYFRKSLKMDELENIQGEDNEEQNDDNEKAEELPSLNLQKSYLCFTDGFLSNQIIKGHPQEYILEDMEKEDIDKLLMSSDEIFIKLADFELTATSKGYSDSHTRAKKDLTIDPTLDVPRADCRYWKKGAEILEVWKTMNSFCIFFKTENDLFVIDCNQKDFRLITPNFNIASQNFPRPELSTLNLIIKFCQELFVNFHL